MEDSQLSRLPLDTLHHIISTLPLHTIATLKTLCKQLNTTLSSQFFTQHLLLKPYTPNFPLLILRNSRPVPPRPALSAFAPSRNRWTQLDLGFLPFRSVHPVTSFDGVVYLWCDNSLVVCNPLIRKFRVLPRLGSAWSRHGSVVVGVAGRVMIVSELVLICLSGDRWVMCKCNLMAKPRSPVLVNGCVYALCDDGPRGRNEWKMFYCRVACIESGGMCNWSALELPELPDWGYVFNKLKRPRLVKGVGDMIFMVGGLTSLLSGSCWTILILRLDMETMAWDVVGEMPREMFWCFQGSSKFKVFGGGNMVCFSSKIIGKKLVLWEYGEGNKGKWWWIEGVPGNGDGLFKGFVFNANLVTLP